MNDEKVFFTFKEAKKFLPVGDEIHTFRNTGPILVGADWTRKDILKAMKAASNIEVTGNMAQSMNHGLAIEDSHGVLFIETIRRTDATQEPQ